ncbi:eukaryotic translation initiation factor 4G isoform X2 [Contarinia nasturtii]|uniref:eukaryotic translation initiation factor 4G isoform X2 n=1 Tax=Contarinia nasturtii TaxID=265458 RepID=UPI0012D3A7AF|nr:eukaryotic translation initiation factor 4G isoform X2 [Contarinia nasturtii]
MSRHSYTQNYGVPSNTHPPHAGANSSNVINRQTANTNKYDKAPPQTNSNKYDQQNQPQITLANVSSQQQQQQQLQQQKNKLVSSDYTIQAPPGSHQQHVTIPHSNFRLPHANNNYHVTQPSVNYSQSVPPQPPTAHSTSDRQSVCQIGQQNQQTSQQSQDHKMQPQQQPSQQQFHSSHPYQMVRGQGQRIPTQPTRMNNMVVNRQQQQNQQMAQTHQTAVPSQQGFIYLTHPQVFTAYGQNNPNFLQHKNTGVPQSYYHQQYYMQTLQPQISRGTGATNPQHMPSMNAGVAAGGSSQIPSHQQAPHQLGQLHLAQGVTSYVPTLQPRSQPASETTQVQKRASKRIPIINPTTNEEVVPESKVSTQHSSGSAALKIEAPTSQIPNQSQQQSQKSSNEPACDTTNEPEQSTSDHSSVEVPMETSSTEEPPHTPVVSAIADGPSVDIMPKQSKNVKRSNKSSEWQTPSAEKTNTDSSTCDNYSKVASLGNSSSSTNNEWVKNNQAAPKVSIESEHKDSQQKHNPKSKHSAANHNIAPSSNKGKAAAQTTDAPTNMVANVQQPAPAKEQPQSEPKPVVPVTVQQEQTKVENTNSARSNEKTKQPPQQANKAHSEESVTKSNKEKVTESTMSNSSSVNVPTEVADVENTTKTKITTNTSIDETDKLINSLDSMSISNKETNAEKNDKLDAKSVEFNNNSQKAVTPKTEAPTKVVEPAKIAETIAQTVVEQPQPQQQPQQHQQQQKSSNNKQVTATPKTDSQTDLRSSENDLRASDKLETTSNMPASVTNNDGLVETIINNNLTNTISANNNNNQLNNAVDKDSDNNVVNSEMEKTVSSEPQEVTAVEPPSQSTATVTVRPQQPAAGAPQPPTVPAVPKPKLLLNYEEGQWSPDNTDGKKCYNRQQIMSLRDADASQTLPQIQDSFSLIRKNSPSNGNNNNKNQSSSNSRNQYGKRPSTQGGAGGNQQMSQGGGKGSKSGMIHVSLSLREDVKLNESATPWKPSFIGTKDPAASSPVDPNNIEVLCKRVRGILNKLTPEKFEPLLEQLQALNLDTNEKLSSVISLVFEKAIDEPNFSQAYAQLCLKLSKPMEDKEREENEQKSGDKSNKDTKTAVFKKELLNKCQTEFNTHVANENAIREKLKPIQTELNETTDQNRKMELTMILEEEERKLRRRSVGTVRFIGELYRQNMLLTSIMEWCVMILLNICTEEKLECLCKLLTTVGQKMEFKSGDEDFDKKYYRDLTPHFQKMQQIASDKKQSKISSRVRFMLMDVIELRKNKWVPRRSDSNPKKMDQIQKEVREEQYIKQIQMLASTMPSSGMGNNNMRKDNRDRNDRGSMPRGGSMSGSGYNNNNKLSRGNYQDNDGWIQQVGNKNRGGNNSTSFDPTKFRATSKIEDITTTSLGTPKQFQWKLNAAPTATTSLTNSFSALESDYKPMSGNRSKEPYHSKGSMERERDGPHSRSGSQHGSRDNSAARNSYSSRSLQMRPPQMQYNTLPLNSNSSSSSSQRGIRSDNKLNNQSLSSSTTSLSTSNLPSSSSLTPSSSDPKLSEDISEQTEKLISSTLKNLLNKVEKNEIIGYNDLDEAPQLDKINKNHRWALVRDLHNRAVDISGLTEEKRCFIGTICTYWLNNNQITKQDYVKGLLEYINLLADIVMDVPKIYEWTAQMISVAFFSNIITLNDLKNTAEESRAKILASLLPFMAYEYGPQYLRDLWKRSDCKWEQFVADGSDIANFVEQNKLKFVVDPKESLPPASTKIPNDRFRQRIYQLVRKDSFTEKEVAEYIKIHVPTINKQSIRLLTKTLIEAALSKTKAGYSLDDKYLPNSIDILKGYIGEKQDLQLESLYAIQLLSNELEHPSGFLHKVFSKLYDDEVVPASVFKQWETSTSEPLGKGVAVKNLTQFLKFVDEDSYDSDEGDAK